jgi:hypothetical protein
MPSRPVLVPYLIPGTVQPARSRILPRNEPWSAGNENGCESKASRGKRNFYFYLPFVLTS